MTRECTKIKQDPLPQPADAYNKLNFRLLQESVMRKNVQRYRRRQKLLTMRRRKIRYLYHYRAQHRLALSDSDQAISLSMQEALGTADLAKENDPHHLA